MGLRRVMVVTLLALGAGCFGDKSASLSVPGALAVGTYAAAGFGDSCMGSKADLCSSETVQRIESVTVDPPGMLEIITVDQVPADVQQVARYTTPYAAHGLATGSGQVCLQGLFSDGTHRKACSPVAVNEVAHVRLALSSGYPDGVSAEPLVPPGLPLEFGVELRAADGTLLAGDTVHPVDDGALTLLWSRNYLWSAPAVGQSVRFGSRLDPSFSQTLATYAPADVTAIHGVITDAQPLILSRGQGMNFFLAVDVGGRRAAVPLAISIRSDTPDVCAGDQGATTWLDAAATAEAWFTTVSEGTCRLAFSVPEGARDLGALEVPYYLVDTQDQLTRDGRVGQSCSVENQRVCASGRSAVLVCRSKKWVVASACDPGICDYAEPASTCSASGCAACR